MIRERESNDYDEILSKLEIWTEELAARGPRAISVVHREMHDYLERKIDEALWGPRESSGPDPEPCIDFDHQKNYD
jgi:hypothetical protein